MCMCVCVCVCVCVCACTCEVVSTWLHARERWCVHELYGYTGGMRGVASGGVRGVASEFVGYIKGVVNIWAVHLYSCYVRRLV